LVQGIRHGRWVISSQKRTCLLTAALLGALHEQFAADWFRAPEAGEWLRQYWDSAMGETVEDLRDRCIGTAWDAELFTTALIRQDGGW